MGILFSQPYEKYGTLSLFNVNFSKENEVEKRIVNKIINVNSLYCKTTSKYTGLNFESEVDILLSLFDSIVSA